MPEQVMDTKLLEGEVEMLNNMIAQVEGQLEEVSGNLLKLKTVRSAIQHVVDNQAQLEFDFDEVED